MKKVGLWTVLLTGLATGLAATHFQGLSSNSAFAAPSVDPNIYVALSRKIVPSVVNISTVTTVRAGQGGPGAPEDLFRQFFDDFFRRHGGAPRGRGGGGGGEDDGDAPMQPDQNGKLPKAMSLGTGFIIDSSGLILTNNHVVADADEIKITFTEAEDEKPTDGEVVGRDPEIDVALIKVKTKRELVPVVLGDSDALEVGEYVMAVGNPFGQGHSVTHGIISAKGRMAPDFPLAKYLQTDAPINPGNSGGPLINMRGEVIGINNAIEARAQGIGFAIPINVIKKVLPQLRTKGTVSRGYIGVLVNELTPEVAQKIGAPKDAHGPFVTYVYPGEPADKAGLKPYDIILDVAGRPVRTSADLINAVTSVNVGESAPMKVLRNGKEITLQVKVGQRPGAQQLAQKTSPSKGKRGKKKNHIETGMSLENLTPEMARDLGVTDKSGGAVVVNISYDGPADKAGLMRGDIIIEVDRKPVKDVDHFFSLVKEKKSYLLRVRRMDPQGHEAFAVMVLDLKNAGQTSGGEQDQE